MEHIKIKDRKDILKIGLRNMNDEPILDDKGEIVYWEFDLGDIELPLRYQEIIEKHNKNTQWIKNQFLVINKRQDNKGKKLLSKNEEDKIKLMKEYYQKEVETLDMFLGKNGVKKFLNGRGYYFEMFDDIAEAIEPILPKLETTFKGIEDRIKDKYSNKEDNILE